MGFEPAPPDAQQAHCEDVCDLVREQPSPKSSLKEGKLCPELAEIVAIWPKLGPEIKGAILGIVRASRGIRSGNSQPEEVEGGN